MSEDRGQGNIQNYPARVVGGEVAEDFFNRGLCLPSGTAMSNLDLDRIVETILVHRLPRLNKNKNRFNGAGADFRRLK